MSDKNPTAPMTTPDPRAATPTATTPAALRFRLMERRPNDVTVYGTTLCDGTSVRITKRTELTRTGRLRTTGWVLSLPTLGIFEDHAKQGQAIDAAREYDRAAREQRAHDEATTLDIARTWPKNATSPAPEAPAPSPQPKTTDTPAATPVPAQPLASAPAAPALELASATTPAPSTTPEATAPPARHDRCANPRPAAPSLTPHDLAPLCWLRVDCETYPETAADDDDPFDAIPHLWQLPSLGYAERLPTGQVEVTSPEGIDLAICEPPTEDRPRWLVRLLSADVVLGELLDELAEIAPTEDHPQPPTPRPEPPAALEVLPLDTPGRTLRRHGSALTVWQDGDLLALGVLDAGSPRLVTVYEGGIQMERALGVSIRRALRGGWPALH